MTMHKTALLILLAALMLAGCTANTSPAPGATATPTLPPPTPTPLPAAAILNGERILLSDYQDELLRLQGTLDQRGETLTPQEQSDLVLKYLVDTTLLAQGAAEAGITLSEADLDARIAQLAADMGGESALADWLAANHYSAESFRRWLRIDLLATQMRDRLIDAVPQEVEQIHARQIRVDDEAEIQSLYNSLLAGTDFETLAFQEDPVTGGDLLWFPRGYLLQPAVEEAAFALEVGQFSTPIQTEIGWHIIYIMARELHPLTPDARFRLQEIALENWLTERRQGSTLEVTLP